MEDASDYPVILEQDGKIKLKTDKMVKDKLYHCVADDKIYLFFKDEDDMLNCYEIEDKQVIDAIRERPDEIEQILSAYTA